jgi:pimeloyl-ACP methyl ester carboxylesterase
MVTHEDLVEQTFDTGELLLNYVESPGRNTPLLLLHGGTLAWRSFQGFIPTLTQSRPVYACDLRGHGGSGWSRSGYRVGDFARDVATFIADRIGEPVVLIGFSLGASVAIQLAATVPHLVAAAVLIEPPLVLRDVAWGSMAGTGGDEGEPAPFDYVSWVYETIKSSPTLEEILDRVLAQQRESGIDPPDLEGARAAAEGLHRLDPVMVDDLLHDRDSEGFDIEERTRQLRCRALLLCGQPELGGLVRDEDLAFFEAAVPSGSAIRVSGGGHAIIWEQPGQTVLNHISRFLATLPSTVATRPEHPSAAAS